MNRNVIIAAPDHKLDGYAFTTETGEISESLTYSESLAVGERSISSFQMAFKPSLPKSGWRIWTPDDGEGDNQDFPTLKTFFLGGAEDGHHGMHTASKLEEKVTSPSGQEYRLCWRFRHWAFYEAVDGIITH